MPVQIEDIKKLREETGAGVSDCREALSAVEGDMVKAKEYLRKQSRQKADKKSDREVKAGWIFSYIHFNGRVGSVLSLACETDFVAKTADFQNLGKELAAQVAAVRPVNTRELLDSEYFRDPAQKTQHLIKEVIGKLGENIQVLDFKVLQV